MIFILQQKFWTIAHVFSLRPSAFFNLRPSAWNLLFSFSLIYADSFPLITLILCAHLREIILKILFHWISLAYCIHLLDYAALQLRICVITFSFSTNIIAATQLHPSIVFFKISSHWISWTHYSHSHIDFRCVAPSYL